MRIFPDPEFFLDDGADTHTVSEYGKVSHAVYSFDTGSASVAWQGVMGAFINAINPGGDRLYQIVCLGSTASNFSSTPVQIATISSGVVTPGDTPEVALVNNNVGGTIYRYLRCYLNMVGTSPSIKAQVYVQHVDDLNSLTTAQLTALYAELASNDRNANLLFLAWQTGVAWGGVGLDGKYPLSDGFGNTIYLKCPAQLEAESNSRSPIYYGAVADGMSHPASDVYASVPDLQAKYGAWADSLDLELDFLGLQAYAFNEGGDHPKLPLGMKMCNSSSASMKPLVLMSHLTPPRGNGTVLDWTDYRPDDSVTWVTTDPLFATGSGWTNATIYTHGEHDDATFNTGKAVMTDVRTDGSNPFYQWGTQHTFPPGRYRVKMAGSATRGTSYDHGNGNPAFWGIQFFSDSPGDGGNLSGFSIDGHPPVAAFGSTPIAIGGEYVFSVTSTVTGWLTFSAGGYGNFEVTEFGVQEDHLNCAVWLTRDGSPDSDHYPQPIDFDGYVLNGPGRSYSTAAALYWHSYQTIDGNVLNVDRIKCTGWGEGARFGSGAYLVEMRRAIMLGNKYGWHFPPGNRNAGEMIRIYGGTFGSNEVNIFNEGAEIALYSPANDYAEKDGLNATTLFKGRGGRVEFHSTHMETRPVSNPDYRLFDLSGTHMITVGGEILVAPGTNAYRPFITHSSDSVWWPMGTSTYNLQSADGMLMDGPGIIHPQGTILNAGNPSFPGLISEAPVMDILGHAGYFPGDSADDIFIEGGAWPADNAIVDDAWNAHSLDVHGAPIVNYSIEWSDEYQIDGSNALKFTKIFGNGTGPLTRIILPVSPGRNLIGGLKFLFPYTVDPTLGATASLYYLLYWARVIGKDEFRRPIFAPVDDSQAFKGEIDFAVDLNGSTTWIDRGFGTLFSNISADAADGKSNYAPSWATHLAIHIDAQSLPAMSWFIAKIHPNMI